MLRTRPPLWLSAPTRFAAFNRPLARWTVALLGVLLLASLTALIAPGPPPVSGNAAQRGDDDADVVLYENIVAGVRGGGNYYAVAADALRAGNYPLKPFVTFRLPTLAVAEAAVPDIVTLALLYTLAAGVLLAWSIRLRPAFPRAPPRAIALLLMAGGVAAFVQADLASFHEVWAGLLIALSLALRRPGRWIDAVAIGMIALLIRETAALYVIVMASAAWIEGERREAIGWAAILGLFAAVLALHAHAVSEVVGPLDQASPGWAGLLGFGFFVKTMTISTALNFLPVLLAALLVGLALFGWSAWRDPLALRALAVLLAYAALLSVFGRTDTFYWGLLVAPLLPIGLAFVPDALRDLATTALDRRRITVTRLSR